MSIVQSIKCILYFLHGYCTDVKNVLSVHIRLYYKVAYSRCAPIHGKCRLLTIDIKSVYDVTIYKGENDVICEFYLSMLR